MKPFLIHLTRLLRPPDLVPPQYRAKFFHLYMEIGWYGVLSGTTIAFLAVFATRQGASSTQIGLLSAVPALVSLVFALPAGRWLGRRSIGRAVFWASVLTRIFYLLLVPLPVLLLPEAQVWTIILVTLIMNIPATAMVVGFNSLFGEVVPVNWRGYVAGIRNAVLSVVATVFTLLSGFILDRLSFPLGYQVVFGLGFFGAAMSSLHLYLLSSAHKTEPAPATIALRPEEQRRAAETRRLANEINQIYRRSIQSLHLEIMRGPYARVMGLLFFWHLVQFMTIPIVTPFVVNELRVSDSTIGLANGLFNVTVFLGSLRLSQATTRFGNKNLTGGGILVLSVFPLLTAFGAVPYIFANLIGGFGWAMTGGALFNYILDNVQGEDRPAYLAWYALVSNAAILIGSLAGPPIAGVIGFTTALIVFGVGRFLAGLAILRWG